MIMPNIRVSDWNKTRLESLGRFGDNHDSVLGRTLDLILRERRLAEKVRAPGPAHAPHPVFKERPSPDPRRARKGTVSSERFFIKYILSVLRGAENHSMHCGEVLTAIERIIPKDKLSPLDHDMLPSGVVRWKNKAQWARKVMVDEGLLEPVEKAGHGIWRLTEPGLAQARKA